MIANAGAFSLAQTFTPGKGCPPIRFYFFPQPLKGLREEIKTWC
jgi:hypothetical protein